MSPHTSSSPNGTTSSDPSSSNLGLESKLRNLMTFSTFTMATPPSGLSLGLDSPASAAADCISLPNTDTENSENCSGISSDSEDVDVDVDGDIDIEDQESNWKFKVTPEITRRLSIVPSPEITRRLSIVPISMPSHLLQVSQSLSQAMEMEEKEEAIREETKEESTKEKEEEKITLPTLPNELKLEIFSHLDPIDATCLALTSRHTYLIYRAIHGTALPLNTRRTGPNNLEYAFTKSTEKMCRYCGKGRCELWMHIREFMEKGPLEREYCGMKGNFGGKGREGRDGVDGCWRGKPSKPRRCGRHPERTTTVRVEDGGENLERIIREARAAVGV
ncbi:8ece6f82-56d7-4909-adc9-7c587ebdf670-CDS [Sclerotinia trifoliorum]|uniref:8ece6f82-56d7-4909-adc9-7c587ebdf670-CDS n=1 Tax=Sclerotinia trifoliorum TaxID=28548 RepID=A0A8H2VNA6_9HELO|nr:8ece6f82-56d7-4909-adc9-7c587ebdf670-CDS [Sclerotinia trifoliorum]